VQERGAVQQPGERPELHRPAFDAVAFAVVDKQVFLKLTQSVEHHIDLALSITIDVFCWGEYDQSPFAEAMRHAAVCVLTNDLAWNWETEVRQV
jgi:hypothetical protein